MSIRQELIFRIIISMFLIIGMPVGVSAELASSLSDRVSPDHWSIDAIRTFEAKGYIGEDEYKTIQTSSLTRYDVASAIQYLSERDLEESDRQLAARLLAAYAHELSIINGALWEGKDRIQDILLTINTDYILTEQELTAERWLYTSERETTFNTGNLGREFRNYLGFEREYQLTTGLEGIYDSRNNFITELMSREETLQTPENYLSSGWVELPIDRASLSAVIAYPDSPETGRVEGKMELSDMVTISGSYTRWVEEPSTDSILKPKPTPEKDSFYQSMDFAAVVNLGDLVSLSTQVERLSKELPDNDIEVHNIRAVDLVIDIGSDGYFTVGHSSSEKSNTTLLSLDYPIGNMMSFTAGYSLIDAAHDSTQTIFGLNYKVPLNEYGLLTARYVYGLNWDNFYDNTFSEVLTTSAELQYNLTGRAMITANYSLEDMTSLSRTLSTTLGVGYGLKEDVHLFLGYRMVNFAIYDSIEGEEIRHDATAEVSLKF